MYSQNALATNEFLGKSWKHILPGSTEPLGVTVLKSRGVFTEAKVVLDGFWCTDWLPFGKSQPTMSEETLKEGRKYYEENR
ncbi:hypothetical protein HPP92_019512 [Vanilla planifolia]|uniref:Uncharacterized protein n=1 Tax=Vanilla planifolia TaxID=51239 RepID=A0A835QAF6_VANPL|nr:hypothetical protein HPP92_019512 [Vanilla planifolia]